jgi:colicin import membrane protein
MQTGTLSRDELRPRAPGGRGPGFLLALIVHIGLIIALAFGVSWHSEPVSVTAELWAAVPQIAAAPAQEPPAPVPPAPTPRPPPQPQPDTRQQERDAQIAIEKRQERERELKREAEEQAQREKADREKAEREKAEQLKQQKEQEARLAKLRQEQLERMRGQLGATGAPSSTGTAQRDAGPSSSYAGKVFARVYPNIVLIDPVAGNPVAEVEVRAGPDGAILGRRLTKSSGVKEWDDAVLRAIDRTQVLPRDVDGSVPSSLTLVFKPIK